MKKIQTIVYKFIATLFFVFSLPFVGSSQDYTLKLKKADSLFTAKLYTQSFDVYNELFTKKIYTHSMLLKMAFIQEGLGHISLSLYYLTTYRNLTHDAQTDEKINEIALKNNLEGYDNSHSEVQMVHFFNENRIPITASLASICIFLTSVMAFQKRKSKQPLFLGLVLISFSGVLFWFINFTESKPAAIIASSNTYLMEGPSAGSSVLAIVSEGHKLAIEGRYDVWSKVKWNGKQAFINQNGILTLN